MLCVFSKPRELSGASSPLSPGEVGGPALTLQCSRASIQPPHTVLECSLQAAKGGWRPR